MTDYLTASFTLSSIRMKLAVNIGGRHGGSATCPLRAELSSRPSINVSQSTLMTDNNAPTFVSVKLHNTVHKPCY